MRGALACLVALSACAGMPTRYSSQKQAATSLLPAELEIPEGAEQREPTRFAARLYADQEVRRPPFWRKRLEAQLSRMNAYLEVAFAARIEVNIREWERRAPGDQLERVLEELQAKDPATDVDWVIGFIAPTAVLTQSHHQMGMAPIPGRHFVVRSMNDAVERKSLDQAFDALDDADREAVFTARREHKEVTVFLHELGHTLGALHEGGDQWVMNLSYHHHVSGFSPDQAELIRVGLAIRLAERQQDGERRADLWRRMASIAEKSQANFYRGEREHLIARARALVGGPAPRAAARRSADQAEIEAALAAAEAGDRAEAIRRFEALLAKHPDDAWLKRAAVAVYLRAGALTRAEALVETQDERARLTQRRRFYGLPPDATRFGVTAELEPDYVAAFDAGYQAFSTSDDRLLRKQAAAALKRFPGAPGLLALACAADFLGHRAAAARTRCRAALAAWDETVLAHFFAGQIEPGEAGRRHLQRALELDPSQEAVIQRLLDAR